MGNATETTVDLSGLNFSLKSLVAVLGVDAKDIIRVEAGQLAADIANGLGPKTVSKGAKSVKASVKKRFFPLKDGITPFHGAQAGKKSIEWLFATKRKAFKSVVGADRGDVRLSQSAAELMRSTKRFKGKAWQELGELTKQTVIKRGKKRGLTRGTWYANKINRLIVTKAVFGEIMAISKEKIGQAKASFAYTANRLLNGQKRFPDWISRHFASRAGGKAIVFDNGLLNRANPTITFGSTAKGVVSNESMKSVISGAVVYRAKMLAKKVRNVLNGYAYDKRTGQTFKPKAGQVLTESQVTM